MASGEKLYARPEMLKLLERIRAGEVEAVLCMDIDRLGRGGMADQGTILDAFRESGTLIITPEKTYDLTNDVDIEMTEFKAFFARAEWRANRKRMRRGLMQTIEAGGYTANARTPLPASSAARSAGTICSAWGLTKASRICCVPQRAVPPVRRSSM